MMRNFALCGILISCAAITASHLPAQEPDVNWGDECRNPRWTLQSSALFMNRQTPQNRLLVSEQATGNPLLNAADLNFDGSTGVEGSLWYHGNPQRPLEFRYLWFGEQNAQTSYTLGGATNVIIHTDPQTSFAGNTGATATLTSDFHSFELNRRHTYCAGSLLYGVRYVDFDDSSFETMLPFAGSGENATWRTNNNLLGMQVGAERHHDVGCFHLSVTGKGGLYWNDAGTSFVLDRLGSGDDNDVDANANNDLAAFVGEITAAAVYPLTRNLDARFGYQLLWLEGVAIATDQVAATDSFNVANGTTIGSSVDKGGTFYHGAFVGLQYLR